MFQVKFSRRFTSGLLTGLLHHDAISFPSHALAQGWVSAILAKSAAGRLNYTLETWEVAMVG